MFALLTLIAAATFFGGHAQADFEAFNSNIEWKTLGDIRSPDFDLSQNTKPILYLFTQPWCGACTSLKESMTEASEGADRLESLSKHYLMVAVDGKENDNIEAELKEDGAYIPRILFATSDGQLRTDLVNKDKKDYPHFYETADQMANSMEAYLSEFGIVTDELDEYDSTDFGEKVDDTDEYEDVFLSPEEYAEFEQDNEGDDEYAEEDAYEDDTYEEDGEYDGAEYDEGEYPLDDEEGDEEVQDYDEGEDPEMDAYDTNTEYVHDEM